MVDGGWWLVASPVRTSNDPLTTNHQPLSGDAQNDALVQAAHPVTARIDRDLRVAERLDSRHDARREVGFERTRQLLGANLHTRQFAMMSHATHAEAELP